MACDRCQGLCIEKIKREFVRTRFQNMSGAGKKEDKSRKKHRLNMSEEGKQKKKEYIKEYRKNQSNSDWKKQKKRIVEKH